MFIYIKEITHSLIYFCRFWNTVTLGIFLILLIKLKLMNYQKIPLIIILQFISYFDVNIAKIKKKIK